MNNNYKFLNPYNFVRYLDEGKQNNTPEIKLLGRCTPPPHDRYIGLTGRIKCELKAMTPIFISDSEFVEEYLRSIEDANGELVKELNDSKINARLKAVFQTNEILVSENISIKKENANKWILEDKDNKNLYFIKKDDSTLNIFVYAKGSGHKSYRFFRLKNENGNEEFAIPSTSLKGMLRSVFEAATNSCFSVFEGGLLGKRERPENYDKTLLLTAGLIIDIPKSIDKPGYVKGMKYYKLNHKKYPEYKNNFKLNGNKILIKTVSDDVSEIKEYNENETIPDEYIVGYLKTSDQGLPGKTQKRNEYVFVEDSPSENFELAYEKYQNYVISNKNNKYRPTKVPKPGDTIWFRSKEKNIQEFGYAQIYRKPFGKSISDLLPQPFYPCSNYDMLCTSCRIFGWVHPQPTKDLHKVAYAGRVKISHANLIEEKGTLDDFPLAKLSTPKPTTTFFYLLKNRKPDFYVKYDSSGAHLRGRKFYLHQKKAEEKEEYTRVGNNKDDQNRTIRDALKPGATFKFTIEFENLAPVEFGALLWSIEMENDMFHKIGLGKPLGFGSVKLSIINISTLNVKERYASFSNNGWNAIDDLEKIKGIFISKFRDSMKIKYSKNFNELDNIMDLKVILSENASNVHYPRTSEEPNTEGKNFKWFVQNKELGKKPLNIASDDASGFPLQF